MSEKKVRGFALTVNNYTDEDIDMFKSLEQRTRPSLDYGVFGKEIGENGNKHLQMYVYFTNANAGNWGNLKKWFSRAHIEVGIASPLSNYQYCCKGEQTKDEWEEFGVKGPNYGLNADVTSFGECPKGSGFRSDIVKTHILVKEKKVNNLREFMDHEEATVSYQNIKICEIALRVYSKGRRLDEAPTVIWAFGPTGSGKTRDAYKEIGEKSYYVSMDNGKWWDNYMGEPIVLIDDWRPDWCRYPFLLKLLDRNPMKVEYKGGSCEMMASVFFVTSPFDPVTCWGNLGYKDDPKQLCRRITELREYGGPDGPIIHNAMEYYDKHYNSDIDGLY